MKTNRQAERIIARVGDLPAMPAVVSEVLRLTDDPSSAMDEMSRVIQSDPALTAKILRVSNSPYYGMKQYVSTLKLALVILGVREVRNIVLGISVFDTFRREGVPARMAGELWDGSLRVASLCKDLCQHMGLALKGEEFVTGLLHDIGKMVLLLQFEDKYQKLYAAYRHTPQQLYEAELAAFACSNADTGMALATRWNLPEALGEALWYQYPSPERPLSDLDTPHLAAVLRIAKRARHDKFEPSVPDEEITCLLDAEAWAVLEDVRNPIPPEERRAVLAALAKKANQGPEIPLD